MDDQTALPRRGRPFLLEVENDVFPVPPDASDELSAQAPRRLFGIADNRARLTEIDIEDAAVQNPLRHSANDRFHLGELRHVSGLRTARR